MPAFHIPHAARRVLRLRRSTAVLLATAALSTVPAAAQAQAPIALESPNAPSGGLFGSCVSGVPDADGDGRGDVLVGAPGEHAGAKDAGRVYLFSGATGARILTLKSPKPERRGEFGGAVSGVADIDGDGRGDFLVGAWHESGGAKDSGKAYLFSGATGARIRTLKSANAEIGGGFGYATSGVADIDGDGRSDFLVGALLEDGGAVSAGRAYLFSGATGALLHTLESPSPEWGGVFGTAVSGVADVDGDGRSDLLVGAENEVSGGWYAGQAHLFSGATGALIRTLESPNPEWKSNFGNSVSGVADVDGDGRGDLLVGAPGEDGGAEWAGRAYLFSGATGALIRTLESPSPEYYGEFGGSVAGVADADGDGRGDVLVGAWHDGGGAGRAYLVSGATGALIRTFDSPNPTYWGYFGISVSGVADANGDGHGDFLVGASFEDGGAHEAGRAYLFP